MTESIYFCPECNTSLIRIAEYTFFCVNCRKKVGALVRELTDEGDVE